MLRYLWLMKEREYALAEAKLKNWLLHTRLNNNNASRGIIYDFAKLSRG